jgi:hypothetical protein
MPLFFDLMDAYRQVRFPDLLDKRRQVKTLHAPIP